jgi:hypothetical protein
VSAPAALASALADRYAIDRELGQGGMATVHLATDVRHDRAVALKVLPSGPAASLGAERFLRKTTTTAHLTHPHILPQIERSPGRSRSERCGWRSAAAPGDWVARRGGAVRQAIGGPR